MADARPRTRPRAGSASRSRPAPEAPPVRTPDDAAATSAPPLCSFSLCPICMALTAMGEARPDLVQHVLLASREMLLALRALIDARLEGTEGGDRPTLERLTIG